MGTTGEHGSRGPWYLIRIVLSMARHVEKQPDGRHRAQF